MLPDFYQKYLELGERQVRFFSELKPLQRLQILYWDIRSGLFLWLAFALGMILHQLLLNYAYAAGPPMADLNRESISLIFSLALLILVLVAFTVSVYVMLLKENPSRTSIENAKFFAGFATGIATNFLSPVL